MIVFFKQSDKILSAVFFMFSLKKVSGRYMSKRFRDSVFDFSFKKSFTRLTSMLYMLYFSLYFPKDSIRIKFSMQVMTFP